MAATVGEVMNRELLSLRPDLTARQARDILRSFGVSAAPVVNGEQRPIGVLALQDLLEGEGTARQRMSRPAVSVPSLMTVEGAAMCLARADLNHLVVVDARGAAVGIVSALDVLRALIGIPARHPATFPHWDATTETSWTDDWPLVDENVARAPHAPGVLILATEHAGVRGTLVWVEACTDLHARVASLARSEVDEPELTRALAAGGLCFRTATVRDDSCRAHIVQLLRDRLQHAPPPGAT